MARDRLRDLLSEDSSTFGGVGGGTLPPSLRLGRTDTSKEPETSSFTRAFGAGVDQLQALGYGAGAVAADLVGAEGAREYMTEGMLRNQEEGEKAMEGLITNWEQVEDLSTFGDYMWNGLGQLAPSMLETTIGAIAGAAIGTAVAPGAGTVTGALAGIGSRSAIKRALTTYITKKGMKDAVGRDLVVKKAAEKAIQSFYAKAGAAATGYQIGVGDVYSETVSANDPQAGLAAVLGVPYAALDFIMPAGIINKFAQAGAKRGTFANAAREGVKSAVTEATTEMGQEELLIQTRRALDPDYDPTGEEAASRRINAFILGGLGGGVVGGVAGGITAAGKKAPTAEVLSDPSTGEELQSKGVAAIHKRINALEAMRERWETGKHPVEKLDKQISGLLNSLNTDFIQNENASAVDKSEAEAIFNFWTNVQAEEVSKERADFITGEEKAAKGEVAKRKKQEVESRKIQRESDKKFAEARKAFYKKKDRRRALKGIEVGELDVEELQIPSNIEEIEILALPEVAEITDEVEEITGKRVSPARFKYLREETNKLKQETEPVVEGEDPTLIGSIPTNEEGEVVPEYKQLFEDQKEREAYEITLQRLDSKAVEIKEQVIPIETTEEVEGEVVPTAPERAFRKTHFSIDRETYDLALSIRERFNTGSYEDVIKADSDRQNLLGMEMSEFVDLTTALDTGNVEVTRDIAPAVQEVKSANVQATDEAEIIDLENERDAASFGVPDTGAIEISEDIVEKETKLAVDKKITKNDSENVSIEQALDVGELQYKRQILEDNLMAAEEAGLDTTSIERQLGAVDRQIRRTDLTKDQTKEDAQLVKEIKELEKEPLIEDDGIEFSEDIFIGEKDVPSTKWQRERPKRQAVIDSFAKSLPESANLEVHYIENASEIEHPDIRKHVEGKRLLPGGLHVAENLPMNPTGKTLVYIMGKPGKSLHDMERTLFHETVGHYGLRKVFRTEWNNFLERMVKIPRYASQAFALRQQWSDINLDIVEGGESVTFTHNREKVTVSKQGMTRLMNEYLAVRAEDFADPTFREANKKEWSFFKRVINHIRHVLRKARFGRVADEITDADITALIGESYVRLTGEGQTVFTATNVQLAEAMKVDPEIQFQEAVDDAVEMGTTDEEILQTLNLSRNEFGKLKQANFKTGYDKIERRVKAHPWMKGLMPFRDMPFEKIYDILSSNALGSMFKVNQLTRKLGKLYKGLNSAQRMQVYTYFTSKPGTPEGNVNRIEAPQEVRDISVEAKQKITDWGQYFADNGLLNESVYEENKGAYLPTRYLKYMNQYVGTGKKTSLLNYLKAQKDLPKEYDVIAGKITDPEFLVIETVGTIGRDVALLQMFDTISKAGKVLDTTWILGHKEFVKYQGSNGKVRSISFDELNDRMDILERQLATPDRFFQDDPGSKQFAEEELVRLQESKKIASAEFSARINAMVKKFHGPNSEVTADEFLANNYKKVANDKRWGALRNSYVRKEIYSDLVDSVVPFSAPGDSIIEKIVAPRGLLERGTGLWKQMKVPFNIPSWFRNFYGNMSLLDISTDTNSLVLSKMLMEEVSNFAHKKPSKYWTWAEDHGLFGTTYAAQELFLELDQYKTHMRRAQMAMQKEAKNPLHKFWPFMHEKYSWLSELTGEGFGLMEGMFKVVRMRDHIQLWEKQNNQKVESLNKAEMEAVIDEAVFEANKAVFNYSKVPGWLRTARRTPLGSPFITFTYKSFPRVIEAVAKRPQKLIKYMVLPWLLMQAFQQENDLSDEDAEEIRKKMPLWMQEKNSVYILPFKIDGKWQPMDFGYFFPWEPFVNRVLHEKRAFTAEGPTDLATSVGGAAWRTFSDTYGFLGGPVPSMLSAMHTNVDDFTGRSIVTEGAPANQQVAESMSFVYSEIAPSWLTSHGFLGKVMDHYNEEVNEFGTRTTNIPSVLGRAVGFNIYPTSEQESHRRNLKSFKVEENKIIRARSKMRKDRNITDPLEKAQKMREFNELLKHQRSKRIKYLQGEY